MFGCIDLNTVFVEATENAIRLLVQYLAYLSVWRPFCVFL